jgi:type IX secretion system PorP/SprF family membrane protein
MKNILKILSVFLFVGGSQLMGQQLPLTNQYLVNPYLLSPAFAGYNEDSKVYLTYRKEWGDITGSPRTAFINTYFPVSERVWLGGEVISDQTDISKIFYAQLSYTYHLPIGPNHQLYFSLWGGMFQNSINLNGAIVSDLTDPILLGNSQLTGTSLNAGSSIMFRWMNGSIGITAPYLFTSEDAYAVGSGNNLVVIKPQVITHITYNFRLNYNWALQPFLVYRSIQDSPYHYDISLLSIYKDNYWAGLTYRNQGKIGFSLGGNLNSNLTLNYTYEYASQGQIANPSAVHEFLIGFNIGAGKKYKSNRWMKLLKSQGYNNFN